MDVSYEEGKGQYFENPSWRERLKWHYIAHQKAYLVIGGVVLGAVAVYFLGRVNPGTATKIWNVVIGSNNTVITDLPRRGHPGYNVRCLETGEVFASQNRAAQVMGVNRGELSKNVRGLSAAAGGFHFQRLGEAS